MHSEGKKDIGPILSIRSDPDKGLVLGWNFKGIMCPKFEYYHLFLFLTQDLKEARHFYQAYFTNLKIGQIAGLCCSRLESNIGKKKVLWSEKSGNGFIPGDLSKLCLNADINGNVILQICEIEVKKRGIIIFNIFCGQQASKKQAINRIESIVSQTVKKIREKGKLYDKVVFNLISCRPQPSRLNINNGLNFMKYEPKNSVLSCKDIIVYIRTIAVRSLTLILSIGDKFNIASFSTNQWLVMDGMDLEKRYFALPKARFTENIKILQLKKETLLNFEIKMALNYTFFDGSEVQDNKNFVFGTALNQTQFRSINTTTDMNRYGNYEYTKGYFMQSNIQKQQSHILLSVIKQEEKMVRECKTSDKSDIFG